MTQTSQEKIKKLRDYYSDKESLSTLAAKEKELRSLIVSSGLRKNEVVADIIKKADRIVGDMTSLLQQDEDMPEDVRKRIFAERKVHMFYLALLGGEEADKRIQAIEKFFDDRISEIE